ncbi:MGT family glycosyltransferase [Silvibacterium bohemicum]|uniref:MGT family glycosyltransferase n=1 Tax=Silvibacterium bohemicum TaxID=1577686 RepID=A0A841JZG9_9BACT|nr:nucleotide disphospho-sugar-binding domain-containing protein [Silvibacterium bohemicum]MBB6146540.1 MGT family glycosyltransferase [Silvibacterium bohemicum]
MKVLLASIPATGHFNPLLVVANILKKAGHETAFYTSTMFRDKVEAAGSRFFPMPHEADQGVQDTIAGFLKRNIYAPGLEEQSNGFRGGFVDPMLAQFRGLQELLQEFPADLIVHETCFTGVFPFLLGPRSARPVIAFLGVLPLPLNRADGAPWGPGLIPTNDPEKLKEYAEIAREFREKKDLPLKEAADRLLAELGLPALPGRIFESAALLSDIVLQPCVPSFEFPLREPAKKVHYIGALLPQGAGDVPSGLKDARKAGKKIVLVSQGTVANNDLGKLLAPAIRGLGDREDFLVLATTGGKPIESIPCTLTPNTVASQYLNFGQILPDVDVLVAFGSYGTVTQALSLGVPMVVVGRGEDKPEVGARVTTTGCGIYLATDTPSSEQVREAVDQILTKPEYRVNADKLRRELAAHNPEKELATLLEVLVDDQQVLVG